MSRTPAEETRRYDSPVRREQVAETRERIVEAGAGLVHELASWDMQGVTVRAVARQAGVHERTVHRHFTTERELHAAVLQRLLQESGLTVEGLRLDAVPAHVTQLFSYLASFANVAEEPTDPVLSEMDGRRKAAILATVDADGAALSQDDRRLAAAMLDVLWGLPSYRRLINGWGLDVTEASRGVNWLIELLTAAIRDGRGPASAD